MAVAAGGMELVALLQLLLVEMVVIVVHVVVRMIRVRVRTVCRMAPSGWRAEGFSSRRRLARSTGETGEDAGGGVGGPTLCLPGKLLRLVGGGGAAAGAGAEETEVEEEEGREGDDSVGAGR